MWQDLSQNLQLKLAAFSGALSFVPPWAALLAVLVSAVIVVWLMHAVLLGLLRRQLRTRHASLRSVLDATKTPTRLALLLAALAVTLPTAPFGSDTKGVLTRLLALATICLFGWI